MKRFTESTKWDDPWFRQLPAAAKLLFLWLVDKCDGAGIIDADIGLASFQIGMKINDDTLALLGDRLTRLDNGKIILTKFIKFQHGELSRDCKAHNPVFKSLESNGLLTVGEDGKERVSIPYANPMQRVQVKVEGKVTVKSGESAERGNPKAPKLTDEEWMASLKANPDYKGINIDAEYRRAADWIAKNPGRQLSRPFFTNWLSKCEKPLTIKLPSQFPRGQSRCV